MHSLIADKEFSDAAMSTLATKMTEFTGRFTKMSGRSIVEPWRLVTIGVAADVITLRTSEGELAVRFFKSAGETDAMHRFAHDFAASNSLAPPILFWDEPTRAMVTPWVSSDEPKMTVGERLSACAMLLKRLHEIRLPAECPLVPFNWQTSLNHYMSEPAVQTHPLFVSLSRWVASVELPSSSRALCCVHHDPHLSNFVGTESLQLIDWEYAGLNDPLFDLVALARYQALGYSAEEQLLAGYGFSGNWSEYRAYAEWFDVLHWLWCVAHGRFATFDAAQLQAFEAKLSSAVKNS